MTHPSSNGKSCHGAEVAGVGVIKPARRHTVTVARPSGFELHPPTRELGYISAKDERQGRGISRAIVEALHFAHEVPLFATTSNERMLRTLVRCGLARQGNDWCGDDGSMSSS